MRLLITRPQEDAGPLAEALARRGHEPLVESLMEIHAVEPAPTLALDGVQAVLLTSANGARALGRATPQRELKLLAVGDRTAEAAREIGFKDVASANGDVDDLARLARETLEPAKGKLLHVGGTAVAGDLVGALTGAGFQAERVALYEARPASALSASTMAALGRGDVDGVLLFSPRSAATFVDLVKAADLAAACGRLTAFCLSAAVASNLNGVNFRDIRVAERPEQAALLALLEPPPAMRDEPPPAPRPARWWPAAAALAVVVIGAGGYALWSRNTPASAPAAAGPDPVLTGRITNLESRLRGAEQAAAEARQLAGDRAAIEALAARLATLEGRIDRAIAQAPTAAAVPDSLIQRLDALDARLADLAARPAAEGAPVAAAPDPGLDRRLQAMEERLAALARLDRAAGAEREAARRIALAGAAASLRHAVAGPGGYQAALDAARALAEGDANVLAALDTLAPAAAQGRPTINSLRERFAVLAPELLRAPVETDSPWYGRAWDRIAGLVSVRRVGEVTGDDVEAIVARAEVKLNAGDLPGAVTELDLLPPGPAGRAKNWLGDARGRLAQDLALQRLDAALAVPVKK
jgi:uroporphyrinogen-III synthase